jgi:putative SOS response-associated peptidase YedK
MKGFIDMCFNVSLYEMASNLETRFGAKFENPDEYKPFYHVSAFSTPYFPVIANENVELIQFFQWGLIPFWVRDKDSANKIKFQNFNARAETIHKKSSFKSVIRTKRCLILVNGFFEWREVLGNKYPYHIKLKNEKNFALAGIWDLWKDTKTGKQKKMFSIITTKANPLMEKIHNTKKRMPVILKREDELRWLNSDLKVDELDALLKPFDETEMEVYPVSKLISKKGVNTNLPDAVKKFDYDELKYEQKNLF